MLCTRGSFKMLSVGSSGLQFRLNSNSAALRLHHHIFQISFYFGYKSIFHFQARCLEVAKIIEAGQVTVVFLQEVNSETLHYFDISLDNYRFNYRPL